VSDLNLGFTPVLSEIRPGF